MGDEMLGSAPATAFVPATDLERSRRFYEDVLGLIVEEISPFACVLHSGGTTIRIAKVDDLRSQPFTVLGWTVEQIVQKVRDLAACGVEFTRYEGIDQDGDGIWVTPGGDLVAWFKDPDGNVLSLTQPCP